MSLHRLCGGAGWLAAVAPARTLLGPGATLGRTLYLDQAVTLGVEELEDLLEVLHLVLGEPLRLLGHLGVEGVGWVGGGARAARR